MSESKTVGQKKQPKADTTRSFESAMARLEALSESLSKEELPLEQAISLYAEGVELIRFCNQKLEAAERSIRQLQCNTDGELIESEFPLDGKNEA